MIATIRYTLILVAAVAVLQACDSGDKKSSVADTTAAFTDTAKNQAPALALTKIDFLEDSFDFGKIDEGKKVEHVFKFKNTGENPLVLQDARASCGCTVPEYTKDTIAPGTEGELKVIYDSNGKEGKINKTVTVTANTDPATTDIRISAFVLKKVTGPYSKQ